MATEAFPLTDYSHPVAAGVGELMPHLGQQHSGEPLPEARLRGIVESPYHDQLVAVRDGRIVGAATMSLILEPGFEATGHLEAFVTDPRLEGQGIDHQLWSAMEKWSAEHGAQTVEFKSKEGEDPAFSFFKDQGSRVVEATSLFRRDIPPAMLGSKDLDIHALSEYSEQEAADLGKLMHMLDENFSDGPVPRERLERIFRSRYHDQIIAVRDGRVVGAATMSVLKSPTSNGVGYLGAFVTDDSIRGRGVGSQVWEDMEKWTAAHGLDAFEFKSENDRTDAHRFYENHGAPAIKNDGTTFFEYTIPKAS